MASTLCKSWPVVLPAVLGAAYAFAHLGWYLGTPLGQVPVLDERENLALAEAIAGGALPAEPFYRAPGYALLLALLRVGGVPGGGLFAAALVAGALLHACNAGLVAAIARTWFGATSGVAAGVLFALHPVFVHYSTQALDAVPALTGFLLGLAMLAPDLARREHPARWAAASVAWAAAVLLRPNYLFVWCLLPLLAVRLRWLGGGAACPQAASSERTQTSGLGASRSTSIHFVLAACSGAVLFAAQAAWQWRVSGVAGFLPWQGSYNLWAANQPGAHGRYYVQTVNLSPAEAAQNPARAESFYLFRRETGAPASDIAALNAHWRAKFFAHAEEHPLEWLRTLGRKAYALLNDWEQYNNKTFAFHAARSPWLRWNPLGWGVCLVLAIAGAARLARMDRALAWRLAAIGGAVAFAVLLFFVSARFRLPLAALLVILAGGAFGRPPVWRDWSPKRRLGVLGAMAAFAALAFSRFDGVRNCETFVQDYALLARAAETTGQDRVAWDAAMGALALQPQHRDARRIAVASYFNLLLNDAAALREHRVWAKISEYLLGSDRAPEARDLRAVAALALWRTGGNDRREALAEWRRLGDTPSAVAARVLVGDLAPAAAGFEKWPQEKLQPPLVQLALNPGGANAAIIARLFPK